MSTKFFFILVGISVVTNSLSNQIFQSHQSFFTVDTHIDTPIRLSLPGFDITKQYQRSSAYTDVDISRLKTGGLDAGFWAIYSKQDKLEPESYKRAWEICNRRISQVQSMIGATDNFFKLAGSTSEIRNAANHKGHIIILSMENAYPLGNDLRKLEALYERGIRMIGLVHITNNQFADSSTDPDGMRWNGLSKLGKQLVREANRLGIILDASHAHDLAVEQMVELSTSPIILSHSSVKGVYDHPRNVDDKLLRLITESDGLIAMNSYGAYLTKINVRKKRKEARQLILKAMYEGENKGKPLSFREFSEGLLSADSNYPVSQATFQQYMQHFKHAIDVAGVDHVAVGADWDGGGGVVGMEDVSDIGKITRWLQKNGLSNEEVQKIWSENILRVMSAVERRAAPDVKKKE